ncbi:MAG: hypothetical protein AB2793_08125, partial [Candidatus Thiodiazotropha sp.]
MDEIENGFVRCKNCGEQEDTKDLDFVAELKAAMAELLQAVERLRTEAMTDCLKECIPYCTCKETGSPMPC